MWNKIKQFVLKDLWLKLFAIFVALIIRLTVSTAIHQEAVLSSTTLNIGNARIFSRIPILIVSPATDPKRYTIRPETVEVEIRGSPSMLARIAERDIRVTVDLTDKRALQRRIQRVDVALPPGIMLVRVSPAFVEVVEVTQ